MSLSVSEAIEHNCSTAPLAGISAQLIEELVILAPGCLVPVATPLVKPSTTAHLCLQYEARASLMHILIDRPGHILVVNSAYRTLAEQLAVHEWYRADRCGITLAARPGANAPHSLGIALDVQDSPNWREAFVSHGWRWQGEHDPMHYQWAGPQRLDLGELSVKAAQLLLNRHGGGLAVDGSYGPATEAALKRAPAEGWTG